MDEIQSEIFEDCGVFGVYSQENRSVASTVYYGLYALQHRGQESAGIAVAYADKIVCHKGMGLVSEAFSGGECEKLPEGDIAIGHVRYSTTGASTVLNAQPVVFTGKCGRMALAHNGNLTNAASLRAAMIERNAVFQTTIDSEVMAVVINSLSDGDVLTGIKRACPLFRGSYALVVMTADKLIAVRDPYGIRPLCIGAIVDEAYRGRVEICVIGASGVSDGTQAAFGGGTPVRNAEHFEEKSRHGERIKARIKKKIFKPKPETETEQSEFSFMEMSKQRGFFEDTEPNMYRGEDLDVPTFMRKNIKIPL